MAFKPIHRLEYIEALNGNNIESEAHIRSVIHQAYYAALNQVQYEIDNRLFFPVDGNDRVERSHKAFSDACLDQCRKLPAGDSRRELLTRIANNLKRAKNFRQHADYNLELKVDKTQSQATINFSKEVFSCLEQYE